MISKLQTWQRLIIFLTLMVLGAIVGSGMLAYMRQPASTDVMRGYNLAQEMGCFACHGDGGADGSSNPWALWGETPPFKAGGPIMSFIQNEQEIREWILYGAPSRFDRNRQNKEPQKQTTLKERPIEQQSQEKQIIDKQWDITQGVGGLIKMPAYKGLLTDVELDDIIAYVKVIMELRRPLPPEAENGRKIAKSKGCFGCHGSGGRRGVSNPGSFKGYIPPWDGHDFAELVENEEELKNWILQGKIRRFEENPIATYFTHGQTIQMPAYEGVLKSGELEAIITYINWLRDKNRHFSRYWVKAHVPQFPHIVERGEWLFHHSGCAACHGPKGQGGVPNKNASGGYVPALENLAEQVELFEKEEVSAIVRLLDLGTNLDTLESEPVPGFKYFRKQYQQVRDLILKGGNPGNKGKNGELPAMVMPAWEFRMYADGSPSSKADIDAVIAYLLTLQNFDEDE